MNNHSKMLLEGIEIYNMGWCLHEAVLKSILAKADKLGLPKANLVLAREFLDGHEFGLCWIRLLRWFGRKG